MLHLLDANILKGFRPSAVADALPSRRYLFGSVVDGAAGVVVGELVVAGVGGAIVWLRGLNTATKITTTISAAIAYQKRLSPKKFISTSCAEIVERSNGVFAELARSLSHAILWEFPASYEDRTRNSTIAGASSQWTTHLPEILATIIRAISGPS